MDVSFGDIVELDWEGKHFRGIFISDNGNAIVIKLDNGYNIGLSKEKISNFVIVEKHKEKRKSEEKAVQPIDSYVSVLGTGGTILSKVEYKTGAVYPSFTSLDLEREFPEVKSIANIKPKQIFNILSEDMHPHHWEVLANAIYEEIKDGSKGIVILHGTDTMHYTASAMAFAFQSLPVPIVFVGSQRSSDRPSSDNKVNFLNAVFTATKNIGESVIVMHESINDGPCVVLRGVKSRKMHTSRRDAFKSINESPLAIVDFSKNLFQPIESFRQRSHLNTFKPKFSDNVAMVYIHPGIKPEFISSLSSYDGVVLIGTGLGHVSTNPMNDALAKPILNEIRDLVDSGVIVAMTSQTIYGRINLNVYTAGRLLKSAGVIGHLTDMTPETAFVKLSWLLANFDKKKVIDLYSKNLVGEIRDRITV